MQLRVFAATLVAVGLAALPAVGQNDVNQEGQANETPIVVVTANGPQTVHHTSAVVTEQTVRWQGDSGFAVTWNETTPNGTVPFYAVSLDGQNFRVQSTDYTVGLRYSAFDPSVATPSVPAHLDGAAGGNLWLIQYWTQPLEAYFDAVTALGGRIHRHLASHTSIVEMSPSVAANVTNLSFVRWTGSYHPAYRLDETLLQEQIQGWASEPVRKVNIVATEKGLAGQNPVAAHIRNLGGKIDLLDPSGMRMQASLTLGQIASVARHDQVTFIDVFGEGEPDMDIARQFMGAIYVLNTAGYNGAGVRGEVLDVGTQVSHPEFQNPVVISHGTLATNSHGTSTHGQIFASGVNPQARGTCYAAQGIAAYYQGYSGGTRTAHTAELTNPALTFQAVFQSNSWGAPQTTQYTSDSQEMDLLLFDNPRLTIGQSQSNTGNQTSRPQAWAKNCFSIGAFDHVNTLTTTDDNISGASQGPANDGRVKPELSGFYDNIFTTTTTSAYTSGFGGTSGATPMCMGAVGIFYQMWHAGIFGNTPAATVFASAPQNTLARAMMIASATQFDWIGGPPANSGLDRDKQGWGYPSLQTLYDNRNNLYFVNETDVLQNLQSTVHGITVSSGQPFLKCTLVFRDNPGTVSATQHSINNLNLKVTSPSGVIYWGNNGLTNNAPGAAGENLWSPAGGSGDTRNTCENVFVQNPQAGVWSVEVIVASLVQDTHAETGALDCDYALCVVGGTGGPPPAIFNLQLSTTGAGDLTATLSNIPAGTTEGYCLYSEAATGIPGGGPVFGITPTALTFLSLTSPAAPGSPLHWTYPVVAPLFPASSFTATGIPGAFFPFDGVGLALGPGLTFLAATSVDRS